MDSTSRRLPPQAIESEMSVLGAIFVDNDAIDTAHEILKVDDFYRESHRQIFRAMTELADKNEPIDFVTLLNAMKDNGTLEDAGGGAYLATLVDYVPMASNIAHYCRIVVDKAAARRVIVGADEAKTHAYEGEMDEALSKLEAAIQPSLDREGNAPVHIEQALKESVERIKTRFANKGQITGIPYGISALDNATLGLHGGELIIIAGRPSMGKTALALNVIKSACLHKEAAMLFTMEMNRPDNVDRLTASFGIEYQNLRSGRMREVDWAKTHTAMGKMGSWKLIIDDTPAISLRELRAKARRQKKRGLGLIVVDYLQLMALSDPRMSRVQGIGEISRGLKQLARELEIPVVALSQLSRSVDSRTDKRPIMSDLRDSGEIEQDADVILFPYRPAAYCEKCKDKVDDAQHDYKDHQSKAEIIIEKQRAGERNLSIPAVWSGEFQRFDNFSRYDDLPD